VPDLRDDFRELPDTPPQWVRPALVVEVEYRQRLEDGLRHAALKGIRPDKKPGMIRGSALTERAPFSGLRFLAHPNKPGDCGEKPTGIGRGP